MKIGIPKERREHELRVAASPDTIKRYKGLGLLPVVERRAGAGAAMPDEAFAAAGAELVDGPEGRGRPSSCSRCSARPRRRWAGCARGRR